MPERTEYAPGVPCWIDIGTDVEGAKSFYGSLFKWDCQDAGPPEQTGGYGFFMKNGKMIAGYGPQQNPGPPFWSTYVWVSDADAASKQHGEDDRRGLCLGTARGHAAHPLCGVVIPPN